MIYHADVRAVFSAGNGEVEVYEVAVPEEWNGQTIGEMTMGNSCIPVSITRAGRAMLPSPELVLQTGDVIHVSATLDGVDTLRKRMCFS